MIPKRLRRFGTISFGTSSEGRSTRDSKEIEAVRIGPVEASGAVVAAPVIPKRLRRAEARRDPSRPKCRSTRDSKEIEADLRLLTSVISIESQHP